jgi:hypothetical protein
VRRFLEIEPRRIAYVSCNPTTQARDCAILAELYDVEYVQPVDMFPQTITRTTQQHDSRAVKHDDAHDLQSADDMRHIGTIAMLLGAILAVACMMAVVYAPQMWGIDPFGSDVTTAGEAAQSSDAH